MKSLLRFAFFILFLLALLAGIFLLRDRQPVVPTEARPDGRLPEVSTLASRDREFTNLVASVLPSVVSIDAIPANAVDPRLRMLKFMLGGQPGETPPQLGSGVIISKDGHIVTNFHVIEGAGAIRVHLNDGRTFDAKFVGGDRPSDIAILRVEADGLQPARWGDSDAVRIGQGVFAVGNPLGLQETVTQGIISGKGRRAMSEAANEFFQTDAAINQGNSGGPLLDLSGELIGITNMVAQGGEGVAFAIPSNTVRRVFENIRDHGRFIRPWFGALMQPLTPPLARQLGLASPKGALLLGTYEGSPAALSGLLPGDVVVEFNNKPVIDHIDLRNRVAECEVGRVVRVRAVRKGKDLELSATIAPEPGA